MTNPVAASLYRAQPLPPLAVHRCEKASSATIPLAARLVLFASLPVKSSVHSCSAGYGRVLIRYSAQLVSMGMYGLSQSCDTPGVRCTIPASIRNMLPVFSIGIGSCEAVVASAIG